MKTTSKVRRHPFIFETNTYAFDFDIVYNFTFPLIGQYTMFINEIDTLECIFPTSFIVYSHEFKSFTYLEEFDLDFIVE